MATRVVVETRTRKHEREYALGQYKVPQNVEAEDKILGPLTFKQFIYAIIGVAWGGFSFIVFKSAIPVMLLVAFPGVTLFLLLAFFNRDGQNFEQLLIAMVGYFGNPRRRRWIKEEVVESFHVTPRPAEVEQTQRNPAEVRSQLEHIASMVDSRGWQDPASAQEGIIMPAANPTAASAPIALTSEPAASEDILDLQNSPLAQNLSSLLNTAASDVRQEAIDQMDAKPTRRKRLPEPAVTAPSSSGIVELATQRDDLTVSQLAATATRMVPMQPGKVMEVKKDASPVK